MNTSITGGLFALFWVSMLSIVCCFSGCFFLSVSLSVTALNLHFSVHIYFDFVPFDVVYIHSHSEHFIRGICQFAIEIFASSFVLWIWACCCCIILSILDYYSIYIHTLLLLMFLYHFFQIFLSLSLSIRVCVYVCALFTFQPN